MSNIKTSYARQHSDDWWQVTSAHKYLDRMGIPRDDGETYYSIWGRFHLAFEKIAGLKIDIPYTDPDAPVQYEPVAGRQAKPLSDAEINAGVSHLCPQGTRYWKTEAKAFIEGVRFAERHHGISGTPGDTHAE